MMLLSNLRLKTQEGSDCTLSCCQFAVRHTQRLRVGTWFLKTTHLLSNNAFRFLCRLRTPSCTCFNLQAKGIKMNVSVRVVLETFCQVKRSGWMFGANLSWGFGKARTLLAASGAVAISQVWPQAFTAARAAPSSDDIEKPLSRSLRGTVGVRVDSLKIWENYKQYIHLLQNMKAPRQGTI